MCSASNLLCRHPMLSMELLLLYLQPILLILFCSFFFYAKLLKPSVSHDAAEFNIPPGRTGLPVIGETLEFINTSRKGVPEKFIQDRMQRYSPQIFRTSLFCENFAVLCGAAGNKFLFSNENKHVRSWWPRSFDKIIPPTESSIMELAKKVRCIVLECLKLEALQKYIPVMDTIAKRHFDTHWKDKDNVLVHPLVKNYTFSLGCRVFMGIDDDLSHIKDLEEAFCVMAAGLFSIPINLPGTSLNRAIRTSRIINTKIKSLVQQKYIDILERKKSSSVAINDIISHILLTSDKDGLLINETEIAIQIIGLLLAGHDTASSTITLVMMYLMEHPDVYDKVLKEQMEIAKLKGAREFLNWGDIQKMKYTWSVACETLRLKPPSSGTFREAITDFKYGGFSVPKGWKLYWSASWTHMNPDYYPEPKKFDPSRFEGNGPAPYTFVPFGGGPRMCPGKEYARFELLVFIHNAVTKYKWEKLIPDEKIVVNPMPVPAKGLPVRLRGI